MKTPPEEQTMRFGKYKGSQFGDLPPDYLLWLWKKKQDILAKFLPLKAYIFNNMEEINARNAINKGNFDKKYYLKR